MASTPADWLRARVRLVRRSALAGFLLSAAATTLLWVAWNDLPRASTVAFSVSGLAFGVAVVGWSGTLLVGRSLERTRRHLGLPSSWTRERSRRAMARVGAVGAGGLAGASLVAFLGQLG